MPQHRRAQLLAELAVKQLHAAIITSLPNIRYLTGFTGSNALLFLSPERTLLLTDPRYDTQAREEVSCPVRICKGPLTKTLVTLVQSRRGQRLGIEESRMSYAAAREIEGALPLQAALAPLEGMLERHRMVKSPEEVERIRRSVQTNSRAFARAVRAIKPGMTESDLAAEIDHQMRRQGAERPSFDTIVASGARAALPHARPSVHAIETNRLLLIDMGATEAGYSSDMTRMVHLGTPTRATRRLYRAVLESQLAAIDSVRAGVTAAFVDRKAREALRGHGLDKQFVHSTGHGLGLEIHEPPKLGRRDRTRLQAGMVVTVEPGVYIPGVAGLRIEDTVLVTRQGCEVLTPTPKDLLIV